MGCTVRAPLAAATAFATRRVTTREHALAKFHGDDGAEGIGFCYAEAEAAVETRAGFSERRLLGFHFRC